MTNSIETLASESTELTTQAVELTVLATRLENLAALNHEEKLTLKVLADKIDALIVFANALNDRAELAAKATPATPVSRSRGPASEKVMSEDDARRAMLGDLKGDSHKEAAEKLGLSYGQIYSARKGFTFKGIYKEMIAAKTE